MFIMLFVVFLCVCLCFL